MEHCDVRIPEVELEAILARLSFVRLSGGRRPGEEDKHHKYRSGQHGDWKKYFDDSLISTFEQAAGNLAEMLVTTHPTTVSKSALECVSNAGL